jgi:hypothetical protein
MKHYYVLTAAQAARRIRRLTSAAALVGFIGVAHSAQAQLYGGPTAYSSGAGSTPYGVAVGDVNNDGQIDIATANYGDKSIGLLLGRAGGGYATATSYKTTGLPMGVAIGDVNGDSRLDLVAIYAGGGAGVLLGQAGGTFAAINTPAYSTGGYTQGMSAGDLNGDGRLDLVTANDSDDNVGVLLGQADGSFAAAVTYPTGANTIPQSAAIGDVNGDGRMDIVTANSFGGNVSVLLGQMGGGFAAPSMYSTSSAASTVAVGDVNGDKQADIVTGDSNTNEVDVLLGQAGGGFAAPIVYLTGANSPRKGVAVADVNGDKLLDVVTANVNSSTVGVLLGKADGSLAALTTYSTGSNTAPSGLVVSDVNKDGWPDIVTANSNNSTAGVLLNQTPGISSFSLTSAGVGMLVTITGANLSSATALTVNGATATIISSTATTITFRVPAGAATTGTTVVTTPNGTTSSTAFTVLTAPGNALAFDGSNDYVSLPHNSNYNITSTITLEAWVRTTATGEQYITTKDEDSWYLALNGAGGAAGRASFFLNGPSNTSGGWLYGTTNVADGRWHHLAGTYDGSTLRLYVDGVQQNSRTAGGAVQTGSSSVFIGSRPGYTTWNGSLDEVRIWNTARTASQVSSDMVTIPTLPQSGLVGYYSFDEGLPSGSNTGVTTLYDLTATANIGTLNNFGLTSGAASNWVESYALVVPTATAATSLTGTSFTANWTAAAIGTTESYLLDVATTTDFSAPIAGSPFAVAANTLSKAISGLTPNTAYYYRVRAEKASVTGQGDGSNTITAATPCVLQAKSRSVTTTLPSSGVVTVLPSQVDNGSTGSCAPLTYGLQKVVSGQVDENGNLTMTAPDGMVFTSVTFASYGTPTRNGDGTYSQGSCHASTSQAVVEAALLGKQTATIAATDNNFGNPCNGAFKALAVQAIYGSPLPQLSYTCAEAGNNLVLLVVTDANGNTNKATALVTVNIPAVATTTWTGAANSNWNDCRNWSYGQVPSPTVSAIIPNGVSTYPNLSSGMATAADITINASGTLMLGPSATLQVNGNWTNDGVATLRGTVVFAGNATTQTVGGSSATAFANVEVNKPRGAVQLARNLAVGSGLTMTSGTLLTTSSYQVALGGAAFLSETENSYVTGNVATTRTLASGASEDFGGLGLNLTTASNSTAPGLTTVVRTTGTALAAVGTGSSVQRYFNIQPATNTGLNVSMDFSYWSHELNGLSASIMELYKSDASTSGPWAKQTATPQSTNPVTVSGISSLSIFTLGNNVTPLPVEMTYFTATADGPRTVRLAWATASEKNSARFEVERSTNGIAFGRIGTVTAMGSSSTTHTYRLTDTALPAGATTLYYRLLQVDLDGKTAYSPVRTVALTATSELALFPNPAHTSTTLTGAAPSGTVQVIDAVGRVVLSLQADATGTATLALPVGLPSGVYIVRTGSRAVRLTVD